MVNLHIDTSHPLHFSTEFFYMLTKIKNGIHNQKYLIHITPTYIEIYDTLNQKKIKEEFKDDKICDIMKYIENLHNASINDKPIEIKDDLYKITSIDGYSYKETCNTDEDLNTP